VTFSSRQRLTRWTTWDHEGQTYHVGLTWGRPEGQPSRLVGFELWATPPGSDRIDLGPEEDPADELLRLIDGQSHRWDREPITGRLLHDFPLRTVIGPVRDEVLDLLRAVPGAPTADIAAVVECRQPRYQHGHYETVARLYREAVEAGEYPVSAVNRAFPWAKREAVGQWVYRCRHVLGLLDPYPVRACSRSHLV
jgi:hypothetical protein